jgi:hypothetical protein
VVQATLGLTVDALVRWCLHPGTSTSVDDSRLHAEIGVVDDQHRTAVIHAMPARDTFLTGWWSP